MKKYAVVVNFRSFEYDTFADAYDCYCRHITNPDLYECDMVTLYRDGEVFVQWIAEAYSNK